MIYAASIRPRCSYSVRTYCTTGLHPTWILLLPASEPRQTSGTVWRAACRVGVRYLLRYRRLNLAGSALPFHGHTLPTRAQEERGPGTGPLRWMYCLSFPCPFVTYSYTLGLPWLSPGAHATPPCRCLALRTPAFFCAVSLSAYRR